MEDAPAVGSYVSRKAGEKIDFKVSNAIAYGNGVGQPLGYMNSPALVTQAKVAGQTAATIVAGNVTAMLGRVPNSYRVLARVPLVAKLLIPFNAVMQREGAGSILSTKIKEMVVIKTSHLNGCRY